MANVKLKDWDGEDVVYSGIETISVETDTGDIEVFTKGEVGEDITADADFSAGDMVLSHDDGKFLRMATVRKPENLVPENILKDVEIAGIIGTSAGGGGEFEGDIFKYLLCTVDAENMEIIVNRVWYDKLYAETGSYDITIPDTFGSFRVVLNSEGWDE